MRRYDRGAQSVRGRLLIVLGSPNRQQRDAAGDVAGNARSTDGRSDITSQAVNLTLTWWYDKTRFPADWGIGELKVGIVVDQVGGSDEIQAGSTVEKAIAMVAEKSIVNPNGLPPAAAAPRAAPAASA